MTLYCPTCGGGVSDRSSENDPSVLCPTCHRMKFSDRVIHRRAPPQETENRWMPRVVLRALLVGGILVVLAYQFRHSTWVHAVLRWIGISQAWLSWSAQVYPGFVRTDAILLVLGAAVTLLWFAMPKRRRANGQF